MRKSEYQPLSVSGSVPMSREGGGKAGEKMWKFVHGASHVA
jgi:hypothetical protein